VWVQGLTRTPEAAARPCAAEQMRGFVDHGGGHGAVNLMDRYDGRLLLDFIPPPRDNGGRHLLLLLLLIRLLLLLLRCFLLLLLLLLFLLLLLLILLLLLANVAHHVVQRVLNPRFLDSRASYDVASTDLPGPKQGCEVGDTGEGGECRGLGGRGLHSFTTELNLSTFGINSWVKLGYVGHIDSSS
jgi:hypothetical protein